MRKKSDPLEVNCDVKSMVGQAKSSASGLDLAVKDCQTYFDTFNLKCKNINNISTSR